MKRTIYKVVSFSCIFSTKRTIVKKLQKIIDKYADDGWKLHSYEIPGAFAEVCIVVFYKEEE